MKRDMDLVRLILLDMEDGKPGESYNKLEFERYDTPTINEHIELLIEAGLLAGHVAKVSTRSVPNIDRLTWAGHDFIQSIRDDSVWKMAKEHVLKPGASWTFDILKEWAKFEVKRRLGIPE